MEPRIISLHVEDALLCKNVISAAVKAPSCLSFEVIWRSELWRRRWRVLCSSPGSDSCSVGLWRSSDCKGHTCSHHVRTDPLSSSSPSCILYPAHGGCLLSLGAAQRRTVAPLEHYTCRCGKKFIIDVLGLTLLRLWHLCCSCMLCLSLCKLRSLWWAAAYVNVIYSMWLNADSVR